MCKTRRLHMALRGKMNNKGQMHTIEALLALMLIIGVVAYTAHSAPRETQVESSMDTQLMLYGEDFLSILDMERSDHTSWLYHQVNGTVNESRWNGAANITREWQKTKLKGTGVFCKVEIVDFTSPEVLTSVSSDAPYGNPPKSSIVVTRLVTLGNPVKVYEVRLMLWCI
jgi:Tfp pilus assembly protein PilV